jgi:hypothetical protein
MVDPATHSGIREFRDGMAVFDQERANVRAAVQRAIDAADVETAALLIRNTFGYVTRRDAERETSGWLDQTLPLAAGAPPAVRGRLLIMRALVTAVSGDPAVRHLLEEGRRLVPDDAEHVYDHALAAYACTHVAMADGSVEEASRCIHEAAARMVAMGRQVGVAFTTMFQANLALLRGDLDAAESQYRAVLELAGRLADEGVVGQALSLLGLVLLARGDVPAARRAILDGASANRRAGQPTSIAYSLEGLAAVALADGDPALASRALAAAAAIRTSTGRTLNPALTPLVEDLVARGREQLDDDAYAAACAEGREWPHREALDRILDGPAVQ